MRRLMIGLMTVATLVAARPASPFASQQPVKATEETPSLAGKWTMSLETPHGTFAMTFDLTVTGDKVGGTLSSDQTGVAPIKGTFTDGKVALTADVAQGLEFHFTFKDKDTLTGNLSSPMGDLACVATRGKKG